MITCPVCNEEYIFLHTHHIVYEPEITTELCEICHRTLTNARKRKRPGKLYTIDEKEILHFCYSILGKSSKKNKKWIQEIIDDIVEFGRKRFNIRKGIVLNYVRDSFPYLDTDDTGRAIELENNSSKIHRCQKCDRPISHKGFCLACNLVRESGIALTGAPSECGLSNGVRKSPPCDNHDLWAAREDRLKPERPSAEGHTVKELAVRFYPAAHRS